MNHSQSLRRLSPLFLTPHIVALLLLAQLVVVVPSWSQWPTGEVFGPYEVRPAAVNVRDGPGTQYEATGQLYRGEIVFAIGFEDGWAEVRTDDGLQGGWIRGDLLIDRDQSRQVERKTQSYVEIKPKSAVPIEPKRYAKNESKAYSRRHVNSRETGRNGDLARYVLLATVVLIIVFVARSLLGGRAGKPSHRGPRARLPQFQNRGERKLSRVLQRHFRPPDYHLMNHITLRLGSGTTQIDHILLSRWGVFVIETKDYSGWIFGSPVNHQWTQVLYRRKFRFQNPILQNRRHVQAVSAQLDFLPVGSIKSIVVFVGDAELKTEMPEMVLYASEVVDYIRKQSIAVMSRDQLQLCVGRLESTRLAVTRETDLEHIRKVKEWHGDKD